MKFSLTFHDLEASEVQALLAGRAAAPAASASAPPPAPPPTPPPGSNGAALAPPPGAPAQAAPPPPPPPAASAAADPAIKRATDAMESYIRVHKATGAKKVLQQCGVNRLGEATPAQLEWLTNAFSRLDYIPA